MCYGSTYICMYVWLCGVVKNEASFLQLSKYYTEYGLRSKLACRTHHGPNHLLLWWQISFRFFSFSRSLKWNNGTFPLTEMRGVANILIFSFEFFSGFLRSKRFGPLSYTSNDSYVYNSGAYQPVLITWTIWFQEGEKQRGQQNLIWIWVGYALYRMPMLSDFKSEFHFAVGPLLW